MYASVVETKQMCMCQLCTAVKKWIVFAWNAWQMVRLQKSMMVILSNTQRKYQMRRKGQNCLGDVGYVELKEMNLVSIIEEYKKTEGMDFDNERLEKGGSLAGYLFRSIHCGKYRLNVDCN